MLSPGNSGQPGNSLEQNILDFYRGACYYNAAVFPASTRGRGKIREFETILT